MHKFVLPVCREYLLVTDMCGVSFGNRKKSMACLSLLFIVILTTVSKVISLHCSDQQLPASDDDDCLVDNCTIKRIDTGEELDIVYTLIVTTPADGCTSVVIAKQEIELPCLEPNSTHC